MQNYLRGGGATVTFSVSVFTGFWPYRSAWAKSSYATALAGLRQINALHYGDQSVLESHVSEKHPTPVVVKAILQR